MGRKIETVKAVTGFAVSIGCGIIIGNAIKVTTPPDIGKLSKLLVNVGGFALGSMVGDKTAEYVNEQIDDVVNAVTGTAAAVNNVFIMNAEQEKADQK